MTGPMTKRAQLIEDLGNFGHRYQSGSALLASNLVRDGRLRDADETLQELEAKWQKVQDFSKQTLRELSRLIDRLEKVRSIAARKARR